MSSGIELTDLQEERKRIGECPEILELVVLKIPNDKTEKSFALQKLTETQILGKNQMEDVAAIPFVEISESIQLVSRKSFQMENMAQSKETIRDPTGA